MQNNKYYFIIAGSKEYNNYKEFSDVVRCLTTTSDYGNDDMVIISGGSPGTDKLAEQYCFDNNIENIVICADWYKYKVPGEDFNPAGFIRNRKMHEYMLENAIDYDHRCCICFWDNDGKGTSNNFSLCKEFDTNLIVFDWINHKFLNSKNLYGYKYIAGGNHYE